MRTGITQEDQLTRNIQKCFITPLLQNKKINLFSVKYALAFFLKAN